jgi:hypothetical protein
MNTCSIYYICFDKQHTIELNIYIYIHFNTQCALFPIIISQIRDQHSGELLLYHADDPVPSAPEMTRITGRSLTDELHIDSSYRLAIFRRLKTPLSPQKTALIQDFVALNNGAVFLEQNHPSSVLMASSSSTTQAFEHLECSDFVMMMLHLVGLVEPTQNPFEYVASDSKGRLLATPVSIKLKSNTSTTNSTINSTITLPSRNTTSTTNSTDAAQAEQQQPSSFPAGSGQTPRLSTFNNERHVIDGSVSISVAANEKNTRNMKEGFGSNDSSTGPATSPTSVVAHSRPLKLRLNEATMMATTMNQDTTTHKSAPTTPKNIQYTRQWAAAISG